MAETQYQAVVSDRGVRGILVSVSPPSSVVHCVSAVCFVNGIPSPILQKVVAASVARQFVCQQDFCANVRNDETATYFTLSRDRDAVAADLEILANLLCNQQAVFEDVPALEDVKLSRRNELIHTLAGIVDHSENLSPDAERTSEGPRGKTSGPEGIKQLSQFYRENYVAERLAVAIIAATSLETLQEIFSRAFGAWRCADPSNESPEPHGETENLPHPLHEKSGYRRFLTNQNGEPLRQILSAGHPLASPTVTFAFGLSTSVHFCTVRNLQKLLESWYFGSLGHSLGSLPPVEDVRVWHSAPVIRGGGRFLCIEVAFAYLDANIVVAVGDAVFAIIGKLRCHDAPVTWLNNAAAQQRKSDHTLEDAIEICEKLISSILQSERWKRRFQMCVYHPNFAAANEDVFLQEWNSAVEQLNIENLAMAMTGRMWQLVVGSEEISSTGNKMFRWFASPICLAWVDSWRRSLYASNSQSALRPQISFRFPKLVTFDNGNSKTSLALKVPLSAVSDGEMPVRVAVPLPNEGRLYWRQNKYGEAAPSDYGELRFFFKISSEALAATSFSLRLLYSVCLTEVIRLRLPAAASAVTFTLQTGPSASLLGTIFGPPNAILDGGAELIAATLAKCRGVTPSTMAKSVDKFTTLSALMRGGHKADSSWLGTATLRKLLSSDTGARYDVDSVANKGGISELMGTFNISSSALEDLSPPAIIPNSWEIRSCKYFKDRGKVVRSRAGVFRNAKLDVLVTGDVAMEDAIQLAQNFSRTLGISEETTSLKFPEVDHNRGRQRSPSVNFGRMLAGVDRHAQNRKKDQQAGPRVKLVHFQKQAGEVMLAILYHISHFGEFLGAVAEIISHFMENELQSFVSHLEALPEGEDPSPVARSSCASGMEVYHDLGMCTIESKGRFRLPHEESGKLLVEHTKRCMEILATASAEWFENARMAAVYRVEVRRQQELLRPDQLDEAFFDEISCGGEGTNALLEALRKVTAQRFASLIENYKMCPWVLINSGESSSLRTRELSEIPFGEVHSPTRWSHGGDGRRLKEDWILIGDR